MLNLDVGPVLTWKIIKLEKGSSEDNDTVNTTIIITNINEDGM